ncbi:MAG: carbamate kinase [Methanomicrobiales archaeon]|nr:carbamate kinase [Methanomicrobiales archaeon]
MRATVALGGNAILRRGERGTIEEQRQHVRAAVKQLAWMVERGDRIIVTHGNGPQVGDILVKEECARDTLPRMPLDVCVAESQGLIGYLLQQEMENELQEMGILVPVITCITQTLVDPRDPAFGSPLKPVGPYYTPHEASALQEERGWKFLPSDPEARLFRRVVPSPKPLSIVEAPSIKALYESGFLVIAAGGGGIPVFRGKDGRLTGAEAVVDKDLAAERLASGAGSEMLLLLTDVEEAYLNYGTPAQEPIGHASAEEAREWLDAGHFGEGSMRPKIEACISFVEHGGAAGVITSLEKVRSAFGEGTGTWIRP